MKIKLNLLVAVCFAAAVSVEAQVVNYNNTVASPDTITSWGPGGTYTYGETFVAPGTGPLTALNDWTCYLTGTAGKTTYFQANIYAWSGGMIGTTVGQAVGAPIFSENTSFTAIGVDQAVTINTGGAAVLMITLRSLPFRTPPVCWRMPDLVHTIIMTWVSVGYSDIPLRMVADHFNITTIPRSTN